MNEKVTFASTRGGLLLHLVAENKHLSREGYVETLSAKMVKFDRGLYSTSDPDIIARIRETSAFKTGKVFEVTPEDRRAMNRAPQTTRGPIGVGTLKGEMAKPGAVFGEEETAAGSTTKCDECGKEFNDDLTGKKLRLHVMAHRRAKAKEPKEPDEAAEDPITLGA